jgi:hypothetical protein
MRNDYYSVKALTKVSFKTGDFEIENIFITSLFESRKNVSISKKFLIFFSTFFKKFISNFRFKSNLLYINFLLYKNNKAIFKLLYTYMFYIPFCRKFYVEFKYDISFSYCTLPTQSRVLPRNMSKYSIKNRNI